MPPLPAFRLRQRRYAAMRADYTLIRRHAVATFAAMMINAIL